MEHLFEILYEDDELLVLNKPAGLVCHPTKTDERSSLIGRVRLYLGAPASRGRDAGADGALAENVPNFLSGLRRQFSNAPGASPSPPVEERRPFQHTRGEIHGPRPPSQSPDGAERSATAATGSVRPAVEARAELELCAPAPRPHLVNRLDRETSGVVIVAKGPEIAGELGRIWESRAVQKEYWAIVHGRVREDHGVVEAPLGKDDQSRVAIKDCVRRDGVPARTEYWVDRNQLKAGDRQPFSLLRVRPHTGRKHQIRIHLAHLGHPVVGDKLYGGDEDLYLALVEDRLTAEQRKRLILPYHALHAFEVRFRWRGEERVFRAEPESWFLDWLRAQDTTGISEVVETRVALGSEP